MTAHDHSKFVEGCYRCDLGRDEVLANEVGEAMEPLARRLAEESPAVVMLAVGHGYVLVRDTLLPKLT